jgi:hypothetical protein
MMASPKSDPNSTYERLLTLWTSGVRDYHTMLSDYLTAHSIFVAVIGLIVSRESPALSFTVLIRLKIDGMSLRCLSRIGHSVSIVNGGPIAPSAFCGFSGACIRCSCCGA